MHLLQSPTSICYPAQEGSGCFEQWKQWSHVFHDLEMFLLCQPQCSPRFYVSALLSICTPVWCTVLIFQCPSVVLVHGMVHLSVALRHNEPLSPVHTDCSNWKQILTLAFKKYVSLSLQLILFGLISLTMRLRAQILKLIAANGGPFLAFRWTDGLRKLNRRFTGLLCA